MVQPSANRTEPIDHNASFLTPIKKEDVLAVVFFVFVTTEFRYLEINYKFKNFTCLKSLFYYVHQGEITRVNGFLVSTFLPEYNSACSDTTQVEKT